MATTKQLQKVAQELDELLFEETTLDLEADEETLKAQIIAHACQLEPEDKEELSKELFETIKELFKQYPEETEKFKDEQKKNLVELGLLDGEEAAEEAQEISLRDEVKEANKIHDLKEVVKSNIEFKILRGRLNGYKDKEELRGDMLDILDDKVEKQIEDSKSIKEDGLKINKRFLEACPRLSDDERDNLEKLILKDKIVHNPILIWNNFIIDGHTRYEIAKKYNLNFKTKSIEFDSELDAILWIKENAISQRNLSDYAKYELIKEYEKILKSIGREKQSHGLTAPGKKIQVEKNTEKHDTRKELSKKSGLSTEKIKKAKVIDKRADEQTKQQLREGKKTIGETYQEVKDESIEQLKDLIIIEKAIKELQNWINKYSENNLLAEYVLDVGDILEDIKKIKI